MNEETRKLFDAPWHVAKDDFDYAISSASNEPIVFDSGKDGEKNSKRLARLPELYDALWESILLINRLIGAWEDGIDFGEFCDQYLKDYGNVPSGFTFEWAKLLEKVRDGE